MSFGGVKMCRLLVIVFIFVVNCYCNPLSDKVIVNLPDGKIQGRILKSGNGKDYYAFQEIPYAAPPIGENRFKEPIEPNPWDGTLDATRNQKVCMQSNTIALTPVPKDMTITEDCLYINVYSPLNPTTEVKPLPVPVLFWLHGGGFFYGSGAHQYYDPKYFMDYDIIVVTMNYRLGPFGFLTTADDIIPGNLGLKDQLLALNWTIQNIHLFGGDHKKITVMGESAGSTSAGFMQLSKKSEGMVSGYILESGTPISPYAYQDQPRHYAFKMGKLLDTNFVSEDSTDLLTLLMNKTAEEIQNAPVTNDGYSINPIAALIVWLPVIESPTNPNAYITDPMQESLVLGNFNKVPLMTGMSSEESVFFLRYFTPDQLAHFKSQLDQQIQLTIHPRLNINPAQLKKAAQEYKQIYTTTTFLEDPGAYAKYTSEEVFATPNIRHAELASFKTPVFLYEFAYKGQMGGLMNLPDIPGADNVGHTEELHYLFGGNEGVKEDIGTFPKADQLTMKRMLTLWTNFIKHQNPTPIKDELLDNVTWPSIHCGKEMHYLSINRTLEALVDPKYYKQVKEVFDKYVRPPFYVY